MADDLKQLSNATDNINNTQSIIQGNTTISNALNLTSNTTNNQSSIDYNASLDAALNPITINSTENFTQEISQETFNPLFNQTQYISNATQISQMYLSSMMNQQKQRDNQMINESNITVIIMVTVFLIAAVVMMINQTYCQNPQRTYQQTTDTEQIPISKDQSLTEIQIQKIDKNNDASHQQMLTDETLVIKQQQTVDTGQEIIAITRPNSIQKASRSQVLNTQEQLHSNKIFKKIRSQEENNSTTGTQSTLITVVEDKVSTINSYRQDNSSSQYPRNQGKGTKSLPVIEEAEVEVVQRM